MRLTQLSWSLTVDDLLLPPSTAESGWELSEYLNIRRSLVKLFSTNHNGYTWHYTCPLRLLWWRTDVSLIPSVLSVWIFGVLLAPHQRMCQCWQQSDLRASTSSVICMQFVQKHAGDNIPNLFCQQHQTSKDCKALTRVFRLILSGYIISSDIFRVVRWEM